MWHPYYLTLPPKKENKEKKKKMGNFDTVLPIVKVLRKRK